MSLLEEIQSSVIKEGTELGPILLKLRLLAARLGSIPLEEWVKHESEGYPDDAALPDYRVIEVSYTGNFSGSFGSGIRHAPIPTYLIEKYAGKHWTNYELRQSISAIDDLVKTSADGDGSLQINASNLILLLQGNVYEDLACNSVTGRVGRAALVETQHAVRSRILELTIKLEKSLPQGTDVSFGSTASSTSSVPERVTQITHQVIYGNVTSITSSGAGARFNIAIRQGDEAAFVQALTEAGIAKDDAREFGQIVASEQPESKEEPFGTKAKTWLVDNLKKAATGTWKMGVTVATEVIKEATLKYYGLK